MSERIFSRNAEHVPKIWGVPYIKVFIVIGIGLLITTVAFALTSNMVWIGKIAALTVGVLITCLLYGGCVWMERQGQTARRPAFMRRDWKSLSCSRHWVQYILKDRKK